MSDGSGFVIPGNRGASAPVENDMSGAPWNLVLSDDFDVYRAPAVREMLDAVVGPGVVDMRDVRYLDCSGLGELARVACRIGLRQITLLVAAENVRTLLDMFGFERLFVVVDVSARRRSERPRVLTLAAVSESSAGAPASA